MKEQIKELLEKLSALGLNTPQTMTLAERMRLLVDAGVLEEGTTKELLLAYNRARFAQESTDVELVLATVQKRLDELKALPTETRENMATRLAQTLPSPVGAQTPTAPTSQSVALTLEPAAAAVQETQASPADNAATEQRATPGQTTETEPGEKPATREERPPPGSLRLVASIGAGLALVAMFALGHRYGALLFGHGSHRVVSGLPNDPRNTEGLEATHTWKLQEGTRGASLRLISVGKARGKVLQLVYNDAQSGGEILLQRPWKARIGRFDRVILEARNTSSRSVKLSLGLVTMPGRKMYLSRPTALKPGRWVYDLVFDLSKATFSSPQRRDRFRSFIKNRHAVVGLSLQVSGVVEKGSLQLDRIRLDDGQLFVRGITMQNSGGGRTGVSVVDVDRDGDLDVYVCSTGHARLYENQGGAMVEVSKALGLRTSRCRCGVWADMDRDGDLDLFHARLLAPPELWENHATKGGKRRFLLRKRLPSLPGHNAEGAGWLDVNADGFPDILLTNGAIGIRLFLNPGKAGRFSDVSDAWGLGKKGIGVGNGDYLSLADFDGDGRQDLLYNVNKGLLARFRKTHFAQVPSAVSGLSYKTSNSYKIGTAWADFDRDGDLDVFVPQPGVSKLFRNDGGGTFTDVARQAGALARWTHGVARTAAWGDVNNDGWPDLVVGAIRAGARLYLNRGDGTFVDATRRSGLMELSPHAELTGMVFADWDRDGDLDLIVNSQHAPAVILLNAFPYPKPTRVLLRAEVDPSLAGAESQVELRNAADQLLEKQPIASVQNQCAQAPYEAYFAVKPGRYKLTLLRAGRQIKRSFVVDTRKRNPFVKIGRTSKHPSH